MKISVSLSDQDLTILDDFIRSSGLPSRSAGVQRAIRRLAEARLEQDYATAWAEWDDAGEAAIWDRTVGDGLTRAAG